MLVGEAVAESLRVRTAWIWERSFHLRDQFGHNLIVAQDRESYVKPARHAALHLICFALFRPQDAAEHGLRKRPTVRHKFLPKDGERLRQRLPRRAAERLLEPIASDVLHAKTAIDDVLLQPLERGEVGDVSQCVNARA